MVVCKPEKIRPDFPAEFKDMGTSVGEFTAGDYLGQRRYGSRNFVESSGSMSGPVAETLQTTVYKGGFDRELYASFPLTDNRSEPQTPSPQE